MKDMALWNEGDWIAAIAKHDEKVAQDALCQVRASSASGGAPGLDNLTSEEIALCRAIEAISAALTSTCPSSNRSSSAVTMSARLRSRRSVRPSTTGVVSSRVIVMR